MDRRQFLTGSVTASAAFTGNSTQAQKSELSQAFYAVVELMGYKKLVGRLQQSPIPGLLQLDVPVEKGFVTQMINSNSIYRITVCDEKTVREMAPRIDPLPAIELEVPMRQTSLDYHDSDYNPDYYDER